ncbi:monocarboxylate transporter 13-like [Mercenaria mercenaria]|uniref:monocarboxylate transporter 13-like n=1 Tax=Mercenaria mercenaria TaxID=6596 RepID=UPI00234F7BDA|nr:monocarboxylate transporter 13-like [Mercenaria mercenaria]
MSQPKRDSTWSWLVLFCVLCCQIVLGGICLSGILFLVIFTDVIDVSPAEAAWLCSLPVTIWFISSPIGSLLTNRYGFRVCSFVGGILAAGGLSLSYFATSSKLLFLSFRLGLGINYNGCMSAINVYFDTYKTLATGISSVGHNLGLIIFADIIVSLEESFGALINAIIHKIVGFSRFPDGVGMSLPFKATGNLIGGPMAGVLLTMTGSYAFSFYLAGVTMVLAACLMVHPIMHIRQREKNHQASNSYLVSEKDVEISETGTFIGTQKPIREMEYERQLNIESKLIDMDMADRTFEVIPELENHYEQCPHL